MFLGISEGFLIVPKDSLRIPLSLGLSLSLSFSGSLPLPLPYLAPLLIEAWNKKGSKGGVAGETQSQRDRERAKKVS